MPLSAENFKRYGVSSTPTIVLVDRHGLVRLYHPGRMTEAALRAAILKFGLPGSELGAWGSRMSPLRAPRPDFMIRMIRPAG
jgi:hypothetical protein